jgi:hypothetical protein
MTADAWDALLSALRDHVIDLAVWLAIWEARREPDADARRCANDAVDAIDGALRELHAIRSRLVSSIRDADDATAARADALLRRRGGDPPAPRLPHDLRDDKKQPGPRAP